MQLAYTHPVVGLVHSIGMSVKMSKTPATLTRSAPTLGQHTRSVLLSIGFSEDACESWEKSGVIRDGIGL